jgi:hypothetical protein
MHTLQCRLRYQRRQRWAELQSGRRSTVRKQRHRMQRHQCRRADMM